MPHTALCFGRCELRVESHELRRNNIVQPLEPTAFALLVYLVRHRGRAVPKDELLDAVWLGRDVSVGSLARAVMQVRRAIGDDGPQPFVQTVHRVGYRFGGIVVERLVQPCEDATRVGQAPIPVALMPFENRTGDLALDWTALGLMALVSNALALDNRLAPLAAHAVTQTLRQLAHDATPQMRAQALRQATGVGCVVHTNITRNERAFRLEYELLGSAPVRRGVVHAHDPVGLGRLLARRLLVHLLPGTPAEVDAFALHDPWCMQLYGRAMQAVEEQDWRRAVALLRVVLDIEHDYQDARQALDRAQAMAARLARAEPPSARQHDITSGAKTPRRTARPGR